LSIWGSCKDTGAKARSFFAYAALKRRSSYGCASEQQVPLFRLADARAPVGMTRVSWRLCSSRGGGQTGRADACLTDAAIAELLKAWRLRRRRALVITETELKLMAAAAKIGLSSRPKNGYRTPAAMGTPIAL